MTENQKKNQSLALRISLAVFIIGALFKTMHWPGASIFLILTLLAFVFWLIVDGSKYFKGLNTLSKENRGYNILKINRILVLLLLSFGIFFKTMHWPFANILLTIGAAGYIGWLAIGHYFSRQNSNQ